MIVGNQPKLNWQVYSSPDTLNRFAILVAQFRALLPYRSKVLREVTDLGLPAQRPLFMHYPEDSESWTIKFQYLFGRDILVAPVIDEKVNDRTVFLPSDDWVHLYDGTLHKGPLTVNVQAPTGKPPVFYRKLTTWKTTFHKVREIAKDARLTGKDGYCGSTDKGCP